MGGIKSGVPITVSETFPAQSGYGAAGANGYIVTLTIDDKIIKQIIINSYYY